MYHNIIYDVLESIITIMMKMEAKIQLSGSVMMNGDKTLFTMAMMIALR